MKISEISPDTKIYGIMGKRLTITLSPGIYNNLFERYGIDAVYLPFSIQEEEFEEGIRGILSLSIRGFNITSPYKERTLPFIHDRDPSVESSRAVNLVIKEGERVKGLNTDGKGLIRYLEEWEGISPRGMTAGIMGCGGAGKGMASSLLDEGVEMLLLFLRDPGKGEEFLKRMELLHGRGRVSLLPFEEGAFADALPSLDLLINATSPAGENKHLAVIPFERMKGGAAILDINYYIQDSPFLLKGPGFGLRVLHGTGMLLYQALESFYHYTGFAPTIREVMEVTGLVIPGGKRGGEEGP